MRVAGHKEALVVHENSIERLQYSSTNCSAGCEYIELREEDPELPF